MPQILPWVVDVQAKLPKGTLKLVNDANYLVRPIHENAQNGIRIFRHTEGYEFFQWHDAAWACRPDGWSQGDYWTCVANPDAKDGQPRESSILDWSCKKLP